MLCLSSFIAAVAASVCSWLLLLLLSACCLLLAACGLRLAACGLRLAACGLPVAGCWLPVAVAVAVAVAAAVVVSVVAFAVVLVVCCLLSSVVTLLMQLLPGVCKAHRKENTWWVLLGKAASVDRWHQDWVTFLGVSCCCRRFFSSIARKEVILQGLREGPVLQD